MISKERFYKLRENFLVWVLSIGMCVFVFNAVMAAGVFCVRCFEWWRVFLR